LDKPKLTTQCTTREHKSIHIKYHWLREKVAEGLVTLVYVKSDDNLADIFTKGLAYPRFMTLIYRVCGVFDVYAATDCDKVAVLFDSDYEYTEY